MWGIALLLACSGVAKAQESDPDPFAMFEQGKNAGAIAAAQDSLEGDPENPHLWGVLGETLVRLEQHSEAARAFSRAAGFEAAPARRSYYLRAQALQLAYAGEFGHAQDVIARAMADPAMETRNSLDWASVAIAARDDAAAQQILSNEALYGSFTRQSAPDAGYSAKRRGLDTRAVRFFERGLALDEQEAEPLSQREREAIRRENRELSRSWSFILQSGYTTLDRPIGLSAIPPVDERAWQTGAEVSRRIGGWRNGRPLSVFARAFHTEFLSADAPTGNATQGWVGVRYKPFSALNFNVETSRLIGLDEQGLDDWSLRAAVSDGQGLEPEPGEDDWTYAHAYGDISYLFDNDVAFAIAEGRFGHAFRLGERSTTITPYAVVRADLDSARSEEEALGAGAGLSLRHWFDENETTAHRGFIDFDIQARERIAGDRRASGVLMTVTLGR